MDDDGEGWSFDFADYTRWANFNVLNEKFVSFQNATIKQLFRPHLSVERWAPTEAELRSYATEVMHGDGRFSFRLDAKYGSQYESVVKVSLGNYAFQSITPTVPYQTIFPYTVMGKGGFTYGVANNKFSFLRTGDEISFWQGNTLIHTRDRAPTGPLSLKVEFNIRGFADEVNGLALTNLGGGLHQFTAQVENTVTKRIVKSSNVFSLDVISPTLSINNVFDDVGGNKGGLSVGDTTDDTKPVLTGTVSKALSGNEVVVIYDAEVRLGEVNMDADGIGWSYEIASDLAAGSHSLTARVEDSVSGDQQGASSPAFDLTIAADTLSDDIVDYALNVRGDDRTIDLTQFSGADQPQIDAIDFDNTKGAAAGNKVILNIDDVLEAGADLFNAANGWSGLNSEGRNQMRVDGEAGTVEVEGSGWVQRSNTTIFDGNTYLVYNHDASNAQLLIDDDLERLGAVL